MRSRDGRRFCVGCDLYVRSDGEPAPAPASGVASGAGAVDPDAAAAAAARASAANARDTAAAASNAGDDTLSRAVDELHAAARMQVYDAAAGHEAEVAPAALPQYHASLPYATGASQPGGQQFDNQQQRSQREGSPKRGSGSRSPPADDSLGNRHKRERTGAAPGQGLANSPESKF